MTICMFNKNHSCCSGELIRIVTSTLSSTPAKTITSTCMLLYYHKITVHVSRVTTSHLFYLLNINYELKITRGKYGRQTKRHSHSVSIIKCTEVCDCVIQSVEIQLIGSHSNCSSNGNFIIYYTFNFVTALLWGKRTSLMFTNKASIPNFNVIKSYQSGVFSYNIVPPISVKQFDTIIGNLRQNKIYLSKSDKTFQ